MPANPRKIAILLGTRPECIKLAPVIRAIDENPRTTSVVISSSQHTDLLQPFLESFGVNVNYDLAVMRPGQTPNQVLSRVLESVEEVLSSEKPDVLLVQGDTTTALAGAISAFHLGIKVGHVEAGLRTGDLRAPFPEEMNRRLITQAADYHFAATKGNVQTLERELVDPARIFLTGNPVVDALRWILANREPSGKVKELLRIHADKKIIVLTTHRRESFGRVMMENMKCLGEFVQENPDHLVIFPMHPNPRVRDATAEAFNAPTRVELIDPLNYEDFIHLLSNSWLIVSDSGGIQEEAPSLGKRLIVLRRSTERPEVVESGVARLIGDNPALLRESLDSAESDREWAELASRANDLFGDGQASLRIAEVLAGS